jgi:hypothetical protein
VRVAAHKKEIAMGSTISPEQKLLFEIFMPYADRRIQRVRDKGIRLVHYTGADEAISIIKNKEVWMRNASCMSDWSEVQHGLDCLTKTYDASRVGDRFRKTLNSVHAGLSDDIEAHFNKFVPWFRNHSYLACVSEHREQENAHGRLSMWRAYGRGTGVGIVLNNTGFLGTSDALKAYVSPVAYLSDKRFGVEFAKIVRKIKDNVDFLRSRDREEIKNRAFNMFLFAALCTKHPGFSEELEWRIVYAPALHPSNRLIRETRTINGIPQTIFKIPLKNVPEEGLLGVEVSEIIERIIIGPTQYPAALRDAFYWALTDAGVKGAHDRIYMSDIPLR